MAGLPADYYVKYIEASRSHWWFRGRERVVESIARPLVQHAGGAIVADLGSGPGGPARALFPEGRLVAIDIDHLPLQAYVQGEERVVADVMRLPCRAESLAAICAFDILEHLDDDVGALHEWHRALAPGGWLIATVPAYPQLWSVHDELGGHRRRYQRRALERLLVATGFAIVRMTYFNTVLLPAVALVRWTKRFLAQRQPSASRMEPGDLDHQLRLPSWLERCCEGALRLEALWLRSHSLPAGVSICAVARSAPRVSETVPRGGLPR